MYSVVLLMALGSGAEAPDFGGRRGGCAGDCYGYNGGCYGGCYGNAGNGCHGGRGGFLGKRNRGGGCHGCYGGGYGGCYGGGYGGCYGGGWGSGCYGGGWGSGVTSTGGCWGSGGVVSGGVVTGGGCWGSGGVVTGGVISTGAGCWGGSVISNPVGTPIIKEMPKTTSVQPATATLVVTLPAEAKLTINDQPTTSTTGRRVFVTPVLPTGKEFHYTLRAEVVQDGKPVTIEEKATVRAGQETQVSLRVPAATVAQK